MRLWFIIYNMKICKLDYCDKELWSNGYCRRHDNQVRKYGKTFRSWLDGNKAIIENNIAKIPIGADGKYGFALVDKEFAWVDKYMWNLVTGYAYSNKNEGKRILMHRLIVGAKEGEYVDHKNGEKLDNRLVNLRICTNAENIRNKVKSKSNTSGFKGVSKRSDYGWRAEVKKDYKKHYAGSAKTPELAARMYDKKALELHGEFARLNFPRSDYEQAI